MKKANREKMVKKVEWAIQAHQVKLDHLARKDYRALPESQYEKFNLFIARTPLKNIKIKFILSTFDVKKILFFLLITSYI